MKSDIHPKYGNVLFIDTATQNEWVCRSTMTSKETREVDGEEIPVVKLEISSASHPFWTGKMREMDVDGKIDRFRRRYGGGKKKVSEAPTDEEQPKGTDEEQPKGEGE